MCLRVRVHVRVGVCTALQHQEGPITAQAGAKTAEEGSKRTLTWSEGLADGPQRPPENLKTIHRTL
eukprot:2357076-Pyramimonas_sp.AAC.1